MPCCCARCPTSSPSGWCTSRTTCARATSQTFPGLRRTFTTCGCRRNRSTGSRRSSPAGRSSSPQAGPRPSRSAPAVPRRICSACSARGWRWAAISPTRTARRSRRRRNQVQGSPRRPPAAPPPPPKTILSYEFWQRRFGGNPGVVGTVVRLGDQPFEVIGVLEPGFRAAVSARHQRRSGAGSVDAVTRRLCRRLSHQCLPARRSDG